MESWNEIKKHWRNEFYEFEVFCDDKEHIIVFPTEDNSVIIIGYLYYHRISGNNSFIAFVEFIDYIKKLGNEINKSHKIYLLCNYRLRFIKDASKIRSLPTNINYYFVDYNHIFECFDAFELQNLTEVAEYCDSNYKQSIKVDYFGIDVITDGRFENWDNWANKGYKREWYDWFEDERFEYNCFNLMFVNHETFIDERLLGFYVVWKFNNDE